MFEVHDVTCREATFAEPGPAAEGSRSIANPIPAQVTGTLSNVRFIRGWLWRCLAVVGEVAAAFAARELVAHHQPRFAPFITFYPAVLLASLLDGVWAGAAATMLSTLLAEVFIFAPIGKFTVTDPYDVLSLLIFLAFGISLSIVIELYHRNREKLAAYMVEKATEEALRESEKMALQREQFQALAERLRRAREEERTKVARDLHDQIGQILTAIKLDLTWMSRRLPQGNDEFQDRMNGAIGLINDGVQSVRRICSGLRPAVLDDLGLAAAIEWQASEFASRTGISCAVTVPSGDLSLDGDTATGFFRIFQECLTNVMRHAQAGTVRVALNEEHGDLVLVVADDGKGFRESDLSGSLGFLGMKERAQVCGGDLEVSSAPGNGTTVILRVPIHSAPSRNSEYAHSDSG